MDECEVFHDKGSDEFYVTAYFYKEGEGDEPDEEDDCEIGSIDECTTKAELAAKFREMAEKIDNLPEGWHIQCSCS